MYELLNRFKKLKEECTKEPDFFINEIKQRVGKAGRTYPYEDFSYFPCTPLFTR